MRLIGAALVALALSGSAQWRSHAPLPVPRTEVAAAALGAEIAIVGGYVASGGSSNEVDLYSPALGHVAARAGPSRRRQPCGGCGVARKALCPRRLRRRAQRVRAQRRCMADADDARRARGRGRGRSPRCRLRRRRRGRQRQRPHDARLRHAHRALADAAGADAAATPRRRGGARPDLRDRRPRDRAGDELHARRVVGAG